MSKQGFTSVEIQGTRIYSKKFDDIYYSRDDGVAESEYVFLQGNRLPGAWQQKKHFCIVETGFGSGLNFLLTLKAWTDDSDHCQTLDYFAIEGYPLQAHQLKTLYTHWPGLAPYAEALIRQYPPLSHGIHSLTFARGRVRLHLIFSEISAALDELDLRPDCWFLDGFAPAKNPSMWRAEVLNRIGEISHSGTHLATFTAAGDVRRNLIAAGFDVVKRKGFGRKREMLCAIKSPSKTQATQGRKATSRTHSALPWFELAPRRHPLKHVAVIGAGIAGAQISYHLAQQGVKVSLFESQASIASGASGNRAGILAPKLSTRPGGEDSFYLAGFLYQLRQISILEQQGIKISFKQQGLLRIAHNRAKLTQLERLRLRRDLPASLLELLSVQQVSEACGEPVTHPGMIIRLAGALSPDSLCRAALSHPGIELKCGHRARQISTHSNRPEVCFDNGQESQFDAVVLTNGYQAGEFSDALDIIPVRGQTSSARLLNRGSLQHAIDHQGYLLRHPDKNSNVILGASHVRGDCHTGLRHEETQENFARLERHCLKLAGELDQIQDSHAGIRATTPDRWPIVGALPDTEFYRQQYADLHFGKKSTAYAQARYHNNIYVLTGLGSRGLGTAAYCANILSQIMMGFAPPASTKTLQSLHPARFMIRALKKHAPAGISD